MGINRRVSTNLKMIFLIKQILNYKKVNNDDKDHNEDYYNHYHHQERSIVHPYSLEPISIYDHAFHSLHGL